MAEEAGEKTEAPTPKRRQQAAEQGRVARSPDLVAAALVVGTMLLLRAFGPGLVAALTGLLRETLGAGSFADRSGDGMGRGVLRALAVVGKALLPLGVGIVLIAAVGNVLQVGLRFNASRVKPNFGALNPLKGFGRIFGGGQGGFGRAVMALLKFVIVSVVAYVAVKEKLKDIITVPRLEFVQAFHLGAAVVYSVAMKIGVALLVLAVLDYAWQRWRIEKDLRMTKQEVKDEMRSMEGDPKLKQRRRQIALQMAARQLKKTVPTADVVVTNPTEFAVALKYDAGAMHAPRVVAKGQGTMAARIRQLAIEAGVPILERKPLARRSTSWSKWVTRSPNSFIRPSRRSWRTCTS